MPILNPLPQNLTRVFLPEAKDLTRVAWLNPKMWAELFLSNKENILEELNIYIQSLNEYKNAIEAGDEEVLIRILDEGRRCKEEVDG